MTVIIANIITKIKNNLTKLLKSSDEGAETAEIWTLVDETSTYTEIFSTVSVVF